MHQPSPNKVVASQSSTLIEVAVLNGKSKPWREEGVRAFDCVDFQFRDLNPQACKMILRELEKGKMIFFFFLDMTFAKRF